MCKNQNCRFVSHQVNDDICPECRKATKTEWVAVLHGPHGTIKIAFRSPILLAKGLESQTHEGWMVASVYERVAKTYADYYA